MANRFHSFFKSAGRAEVAPDFRPARKPGLLSRLLSPPAPSDPLYLSNRSFFQKARRFLLVAVPLVLLVGGLFVATQIDNSRTPKPVAELTPEEVAAKTLPAFNKEIKLDSNKDLQVIEVHVEHSRGTQLVGNLRNTTTHPIAEAVVVFDLVDASRSQLGGVTVTETGLLPGAIRSFRKPIEQANAAYVVVRELRSQ
jgi:hypothetical protein